MEGILLGNGAFFNIIPIILGLLVLGCGVAEISLGHASDAEAVGRQVYSEPEKNERRGEEKEHIHKAA